MLGLPKDATVIRKRLTYLFLRDILVFSKRLAIEWETTKSLDKMIKKF